MSIQAWWPHLSPEARDWLVDHNGDVVPAAVVREIVAAGGVVSEDADWVGEISPEGLVLSDDAVDWVEAVANGEV